LKNFVCDKKENEKMENMDQDNNPTYTRYTFGDTEFVVPSRYVELAARGSGAQGMVW